MNFNENVRTQSVDRGLQSYMTSVFNMMASGLCLTGFVAFIVAHNIALANFIYGNFVMNLIVSFAPFVFVLIFSMKIGKMTAEAATTCFYVFSALMGVSLGFVFLVYTGTSIARVFFITAATFLSMSIYGYTTKKDLTGIGSFLIMGVFGIIIASLVNIFMRSSMLDFCISIIGVLLFTGLTAYDTQKAKYMYSTGLAGDTIKKMAMFSALNLYMDFINMFLYLLRLFGDRRD